MADPKRRRVDIRGILANPDLRRELMVPTLQATQAREGIETSREQAERAYYVVTEAERATFFDLERFRGGRGQPDQRHEMFAQALREETVGVRFDVARRDFGTVEGSPLAYRRIGVVAPAFRQNPALEPNFGRVRVGGYTGDDERYLRMWWEVQRRSPSEMQGFSWEPYAKGGEYSRFYSDVYLVVHWDHARRTFADFYGRAGRASHLPDSVDDYFKASLTWPRRTQRGFNLRLLREGCVFSNKGPVILAQRDKDLAFLLGVGNSLFSEFLLMQLTSFGSWEAGIVRRLPVPQPAAKQHDRIATLANAIHDAKAVWDEGNEISTHFKEPWTLRNGRIAPEDSISIRLEHLTQREAAEDTRIQSLYSELNDEVFKLYGIPEGTRAIIEETLGERPPEVIWPQMEGKTAEQKRMEHVFRLLSYAVKRVIETDEDGIVPFSPTLAEPSLLDRVISQLHTFFPEQDPGRVEADLANELKKGVKGYRRAASIREWLANCFLEYHCSLYQSRPIFWHIASGQDSTSAAFGALVHYHKFDKNRMARLRSTHLREAMDTFRREAALAAKEGRTDDRVEWQTKLEEAQELDRRLQWIQEGHHEGPDGGDEDYRILTPWKKPHERPKGWDPNLDDGVKVNIEPLQKAGVLRIAKVV